jgi:hypothetical protein
MSRGGGPLLALALGVSAWLTGGASAVGPDPFDPPAIKAQIEDILSKPPFRSEQTRYRYQYRGKFEAASDDSSLTRGLIDLLAALARFLARFAEVLLWAAVIGILVAIVVYRERWLRLIPRRRKRAAPVVLPKAMFGEDERREPLPGDVAAAARDLIRHGRSRAGLSLLYRGALIRLIVIRGAELPESATEEDCIREVARIPPAEMGDYFSRLTRAWQLVAYAAISLDPQELESLCESWHRHFQASP